MNFNKMIDNLDIAAKGVWFPIVVGVVLFLFMLFMRKRLSWREILFIYGIIGFLTWMTDNFVAGIIDAFDLGDPQKEGIGEIFTYGIIPPSLAVISLNYKGNKKWVSAIFFTVLSLLFEWGLVQVGYMKLKGWVTIWSSPVYLGMFGLILPWLLGLLRKEHGNAGNPDRKFNLNLFKDKAR